jgi:hypothetical protein
MTAREPGTGAHDQQREREVHHRREQIGLERAKALVLDLLDGVRSARPTPIAIARLLFLNSETLWLIERRSSRCERPAASPRGAARRRSRGRARARPSACPGGTARRPERRSSLK